CVSVRGSLPLVRALDRRRELQRQAAARERGGALGVPSGVNSLRRLDAGAGPGGSGSRKFSPGARFKKPFLVEARQHIPDQGIVLGQLLKKKLNRIRDLSTQVLRSQFTTPRLVWARTHASFRTVAWQPQS